MTKITIKNTNETAFGVKLPASLAKKIRLEARKRDLKIKELVVLAFEEYLKK